MEAHDLVREGRLSDALASLQNDVRANPSDAKQRTFLFQLLSVMGQWQRALNQLNVAGELDASALAMMHTYRDAINCEAFRDDVMQGARKPVIFGEPEQWLALHMQAASLSAQGNFAKAQSVREKAYEDAPMASGSIDGAPFEWIADADTRLGPVLEVVVNGRYYWVPFHRIASLQFEAPTDLRDMVWKPAYITWANGGEIVGLVPCRYVGSTDVDDDSLRLARATHWQDKGADEYHGLGQRVLATDQGEYPILEIESIEFAVPNDSDADADGDDA